MSLPTAIASYSDIEQVLDQILAAGGGRMQFDSQAQAIRFRLRAYNFRSLARKRHRELYADNYLKANDCPYDHLVIRLGVPGELIFEVGYNYKAILVLNDGREVEPSVEVHNPMPAPTEGSTWTEADLERALSGGLDLEIKK